MHTLSLDEIKILECTVCASESLPDAVIAGQMLFLLHSRSRWSDAQYVVSLTLDGDADELYIQAQTERTKTHNTTRHKEDFLPLTGIAFHFCQPWARVWLDKRAEAGLTCAHGKPMLPVLLTNDLFGNIPMTPGEANRWLREILLQGGVDAKRVARISTHSLKATTLSWAAKFGVPLEVRRILGYHSIKGIKSVLHYSRDEQAAPLRCLLKVLRAVEAGTFIPDASRSGRFVKVQPASAPASDSAPSISSDSSESSTSGSSSSQAAMFVAEAAVPGPKQRSAAKKASGVLLKHRKLHTLHMSREGDDLRLACGRALTSSYSVVDSPPDTLPMCQVCFGTKE
eukprot:6481079-Amphidinium_carterae.1